MNINMKERILYNFYLCIIDLLVYLDNNCIKIDLLGIINE
jgi:hypothetical protein